VTRPELLERVERRIRGIPGVVDMRFLDEEFKEHIVSLEEEAERNGAAGGLMPFTNKGVWETLKREVCLMIVIGHTEIPEVTSDHAIYLLDRKGQVVGEYIGSKEKREELRARGDVYFLSDDFVIYSGLDIKGEPYFLIPEIEFHGLDGIEGVTNVTSGSVSTLADHFTRSSMGHLEGNRWTHLVGFDPVEK